jgi:hypothetical protein
MNPAIAQGSRDDIDAGIHVGDEGKTSEIPMSRPDTALLDRSWHNGNSLRFACIAVTT